MNKRKDGYSRRRYNLCFNCLAPIWDFPGSYLDEEAKGLAWCADCQRKDIDLSDDEYEELKNSLAPPKGSRWAKALGYHCIKPARRKS